MKKLKESTVWIIIWILIYLAGFLLIYMMHSAITESTSSTGNITGFHRTASTYRTYPHFRKYSGDLFHRKIFRSPNFTVETSANHSLFRNFCKCNIFCNRTKQYQRRRFSDRIFFNRTGLCISVPMQRYTQISFPHTIRRMDRRICNFK